MMKKLLALLLFVVLLLTACGKPDHYVDDSEESTQEPTVEATQPTEPWIEALGMPWDTEGVLLEIPLTIPDGMHYSGTMDFDGDLLLWSIDQHRADTTDLELCLVDLQDGSVTAQRDIPISRHIVPQILGGSLFVCDCDTGTILRLDKNLLTVESWQTEPMEGSWYMGAGEKLYIYNWDNAAYVRDLTTGETTPLLEGAPVVQYLSVYGDVALVEYYRADTGAKTCAVVELVTGEIRYPVLEGSHDVVSYSDGNWLFGEYGDALEYFLCLDGSAPMIITFDGGMIDFLGDDYLLATDEEESVLLLYDLEGNLISRCSISGQPYSYTFDCVIWSEEYNGYFLTVNAYDSNQRLLFWDITKGTEGDDLLLAPIPEPSEMEAMVTQRARELSEKYGVTILVGDQCDTIFDEFTASITEDWDQVNDALDTLDNALSVYPEGFFRQLRWDTIYSIRIHLVTDLIADGSGRYGDGYSAFTQSQWDHYLMVMDIGDSYEHTYYHEISHIIDTYLAWDSWQREDALFSDVAWMSMNPSWFTGYTYDYGWEQELKDWTSFVDSYSTISPTEDRARVMEYGMADFGQWTFEDADILMAKLAFYSRCIRDAFDTEGWPDVLPWEQYLQ